MILIYFVVFLFLQVGLEISLVGCTHKGTTTKVKTSTTVSTTTAPVCNDIKCEAQNKEPFCLCANYKHPNRSTDWPIPKKDTCPSIGCMLSGQYCFCKWTRGEDIPISYCDCAKNYNCNQTECSINNSLYKGCYCYFGDKEIRTNDMPPSKKCSDLLREVGDHNGRYQCSSFSCNCDQYDNCVCNPPKNKNPETIKPNECDYEKCQKRSFEFCQCTSTSDCFPGTCKTMFKKLPKSGICSGMLNSSYNCKNVGQKCSCEGACTENCLKPDYKESNKKPTVCTCVDVDPLEPNAFCSDTRPCCNCQSQSTGSCICTFGELAIRIPNAPKNCSALEKSKAPKATKFDACQYREGQVCECKQNTNTGQKECFCQNTLKKMPPFSPRSHPYECCNVDSDCIAHSELYCYCTNYENNTYVKKISRSSIATLSKLEFDANAVEKLCTTVYAHPPDISCHPFGYKANCALGFCNLKQINLYYTKVQ